MLSYAATGNPHQLSEQRRRAMAGLGRLTPLPRWRRGRSHRVSDPQENPTDPVTPTEPARPSRPEQATIVRRRTTTPQPASSPLASAPAPACAGRAGDHAHPPDHTGRRRGSTPAAGRPVGGRTDAGHPGRRCRERRTGYVRPPEPATERRPAAGHLHRQVWNGQRLGARRRRPRVPPRPAPTGRRPRRPTTRPCSGHRTRRPGPTTADPKPAPPAGPTPSTTRGGPDEHTRRLALAPPVPRPAHRPGPRRPRPGPDHQDHPRHRRQHRRTRGRPHRRRRPPETTTTATTKPTAVPTNPDECVAQWAKGPDRDACLYREYGYTPSAQPTRNRTTGRRPRRS